MRKLFFTFLLIISLPLLAKAQYVMEQDSSILINNMYIQMEVTASVNALYNAEHEKAEKNFRWLRYRFPHHPLPYFLFGLNEWWKIMPEPHNTSRDDIMLAYMDTSLFYAEKLFEKDPENTEAAFFLSAIHGFKGRLYAERGSWTKGAFAAKNSLKYLELSKGQKDLSPEFLFGDGLYNYYREWIPENYGILKPVLRLFDPGDKELGVQQLTTVSRMAFYTRTEAQYFLMRILAVEEGEIQKGHQLSEYLHQTFPKNAYFHRFYARLLYSTGRLENAKEECLEIIANIDSAMAGYGATSGRYAGFFLGQIYERKKEYDEAKHYYQRAIEFSESIGEEEAGYYLYSLYHLGVLAERDGDTQLAKEYFKKAKKKAKRGETVHNNAKDKLKEL
ncbi:tetratricopeptide repeat protein [Marivirga sp. S37H4]|uniref:Tetratricopeptide repeat protein n=1 Tax=Marivirga aurantiaca TaxID=2802615 RepID=A0A934WZ30_9BACT|nr:tetratricopeptide repeat protein [Marivirga aurantiaca]MBK6265492.1 tetratricopeptide repeat protein [Marivirga aurantiaca]